MRRIEGIYKPRSSETRTVAKVIPAAGIQLTGRMGNVVFCHRGNVGFVRKWVRPRDPRTNKQLARRGRFEAAVAAWQELADDDKAKYRKGAEYMRRTGYHLFLSEFMAGVSWGGR